MFSEFYEHINFDEDKKIHDKFYAKVGDTKSRGFYVSVIKNGIELDITNKSMTFYCEKPDKTRVFTESGKDGNMFKIDLPNQTFTAVGIVKCELTLRGNDGEVISSRTFEIKVNDSLVDGSLVSEDDLSGLELLLEIVPEIRENELVRISNENERVEFYNNLVDRVNSGEFNGNGLEFNWNGTQLGIRVEGETDYLYRDLQGPPGTLENFDISHIETALGFIPKDYQGGTNINIVDNVINANITSQSIIDALGYTPADKTVVDNLVSEMGYVNTTLDEILGG